MFQGTGTSRSTPSTMATYSTITATNQGTADFTSDGRLFSAVRLCSYSYATELLVRRKD
jgi:hypothetical protein